MPQPHAFVSSNFKLSSLKYLEPGYDWVSYFGKSHLLPYVDVVLHEQILIHQLLSAAAAPASVAALTAPTSPRTITVTNPPPTCSFQLMLHLLL